MSGAINEDYLLEKSSQSNTFTRTLNSIEYLGFLQQVINSSPFICSLLNSHYQVVLTNSHLIKSPGLLDIGRLIVGQPGNVIACMNQRKSGICKNPQSCQYCAIIDTIKQSRLESCQVKNEFRVNINSGDKTMCYDIRVTCSPVYIEGKMYTLMNIEDQTAAKRKEDLERVFFHDILNRLGGFKGIIQLVKNGKPHRELGEYIDMLETIGDMIIDDIVTQRYLESPESDNLILNIREYSSVDIIESVRKQIAFHPVMNSMHINLSILCSDFKLNTDSALLKRILLNMVKNAAEASPQHGIIRISAFRKNGFAFFSVNNIGSIASLVQRRIFERSFSTKATDRGLGTYSMKLFGENYLKGKVYFHSSEKSGTTFFIELPVK